MAKLFSPRYLQSLTNINKSLNIKYSPFVNMKHNFGLAPMSQLSIKTYTSRDTRLLFNERINAATFYHNLGNNSQFTNNFTTSQWCLKTADKTEPEQPKKQGIVARFKDLTKKYWYVLVPVHVITSAGWLAGFYYLSTR